jgi:hypothetical protein
VAELSTGAPSPIAFSRQLIKLPESERARVLLDVVRQYIAEVMGTGAPTAFEALASWRQLGIYQKSAGALRDRLWAIGLHLTCYSIFRLS